MASGYIGRLVKRTGFGFVRRIGGGEEISFHSTTVAARTLDQLAEGQEVEFVEQADFRDEGKSPAVNIRLVLAGQS